MYIFYITLIVLIFVFLWQTIYTVISAYYSNASKSQKSIVGNLWFICLLIINLSLVIFIYLFYYYTSIEPGEDGLDGNRGFKGLDGEPCSIKDENCNRKYNMNN